MARGNKTTRGSIVVRRLLVGAASIIAIAALGVGGLIIMSPIQPQIWDPPEGDPTPSCEAGPVLPARSLVQDLPGTADGLSFDETGRLHAALANGSIVRIDVASGKWKEVGVTRTPAALLTGLAVAPSGLAYAVDERGGALYEFQIKDGGAAIGRLRVSAVGDKPLRWTNDVTIGADGIVYFTATSQRRNLDENFDEVLEHSGSGQLLAYDPSTGLVRELSGTLQMANGIAPGASRSELLVVETSEYRVRSFRRDEGGDYTSAVAVQNLPGMPGNIRRSPSGSYWVTLLSPRNAVLDNLAGSALLRRLMAWMPESMRPQSATMACVIQLTSDGNGYQARAYRLSGREALPSFSTAIERDGRLYLSPAGFGRSDEPRLFVADLPR